MHSASGSNLDRFDVRPSASRFVSHLHQEVDPMSVDPSSPRYDTEHDLDAENRLAEDSQIPEDYLSLITTYVWHPEPPAARRRPRKERAAVRAETAKRLD